MAKQQVGRRGFLKALNHRLELEYPGLAPFRNIGDQGYEWPPGTSMDVASKYQIVASKVHQTHEYDPFLDKRGL